MNRLTLNLKPESPKELSNLQVPWEERQKAKRVGDQERRRIPGTFAVPPVRGPLVSFL